MLAKIYLYTWLAIVLVFAVLLAAGSMTLITLVVFGFIIFGMVFMGMMGVLPTVVAHRRAPAEPVKEEVSPETVTAPIQHGAHSVRV